MRYIVILFLSSISLFSNDWIRVADGDDEFGAIVDFSCIDNNCYAQAHWIYWRIFRSTDYGETWDWAFNSRNWNDHGAAWIPNTSGGHWSYPNHYFVASDDNPYIFKSTDNGNSFKAILIDSSESAKSYSLLGFAMYDSLIGFTYDRYSYFITFDGWETNQSFSKSNYDSYRSLVFLDSNKLALVLKPDIYADAFVTFDISTKTWDTLSYFPSDSGVFIDVIAKYCFVNDSLGFACGSGYDYQLKKDTYYDIIYKTTNKGHTWKQILKNYQNPFIGFSDISFADTKNGIAVNKYGKIAMTNDGGETWVYEEYPNQMSNSLWMKVTWSGSYPLIGTYGEGLFRYEGGFFDFPPDTSTKPIPKISVESYDFGKFNLSQKDEIQMKLYVKNTSESNLRIYGNSDLNDDAFIIRFLPVMDSAAPKIIQPGEDIYFIAYFKPTEEREYIDSIVFYSNADNSDNVVYLRGEGVHYPIIITEDYNFRKWDISNEDSASKLIRIFNIPSKTKLEIYGYSEINDSVFSTNLPEIDSLNPIVLEPQGTYEFMIYFKPTEPKFYQDSIIFYCNAHDSDNVMYLKGEGIDTSTSVVDYNIFKDLEISPNPATDYIELNTKILETSLRPVSELVEIFDVLGRNVEIEFKNEIAPLSRGGWGCVIDVSYLQPGIYFVRVGDEFLKFVKM